MTEERQPHQRPDATAAWRARRGVPEAVAAVELVDGPVVARDADGRLIVALEAPRDAPPRLVTTRIVDGTIEVVLQPTITRDASETVAWHIVAPWPDGSQRAHAGGRTTVRIRGIGAPIDRVLDA